MTRKTLAEQSLPSNTQESPSIHEPQHGTKSDTGISQPTSFGASFASSQRVVKDGQVIITGSDTESLGSQDSSDDLLRQLLGSPEPSSPSKRKDTSNTSAKFVGFQIPTTPRKYKFSLDDLIVGAVDDRETEAKVSKMKSTFKSPSSETKVNRTPKQRSRMFRDRIFASAVGENTDKLELQRLKDAVDRTEAFDQGKSWSFFKDSVAVAPLPAFPGQSLASGSWESGLIGKLHALL